MKPFFTTPIFSYPLNRPLTLDEKGDQVLQKEPSPCQPWFALSVIKMNSTFLECPDKWFAEKGTIAGPLIVLNAIPLLAMFFFPILTIIRWSGYSTEGQVEAVLFAIFVFLLCGSVVWMGSYFFKKEMFRYTHYPVRFNRKTRKVYRFRDDGTIMIEDWDKLFFFKGAVPGIVSYSFVEVRCHRLAEDGETVLDTFAIPSHSTPDDQNMMGLWEFIRHYMEEGPADLVKNVPFVQDIADRREKFWDGFQTLQSSSAGPSAVLAILMAPLSLFHAVGRWIAMRTCKIPVWPAEIEAECQIEPDDPYIRDRDHLADPDTVELPAGSIAGRLRERRRQRMQK